MVLGSSTAGRWAAPANARTASKTETSSRFSAAVGPSGGVGGSGGGGGALGGEQASSANTNGIAAAITRLQVHSVIGGW